MNDADKLLANFVTPSTAGSLSFTLTATDTKGATGSNTVVVSIIKPTPAPVEPPAKKSSGGSQGILVLLLVSMIIFRQNAIK